MALHPIFWVGLAILATIYLARPKPPARAMGAEEPPAAPQAIPVIGHLVGFMRKKFAYFAELRYYVAICSSMMRNTDAHHSQKTSAPIFTVSLLGRKMYMVQSVPLIQAAQKQYRELSFTPIEAHFTTKMVGTSEEAKKIFAGGVNAIDSDSSVPVEFHDGKQSRRTPVSKHIC